MSESRVRKYTTRMKEFKENELKSNELKSRRDNTIRKMYKVMHSIDELISQGGNVSEGLDQGRELDKVYSELLSIHEESENLLEFDDSKVSESKLERVEKDLGKHKAKFEHWVKGVDAHHIVIQSTEGEKSTNKLPSTNESKPANPTPSICNSAGRKSTKSSRSSKSSKTKSSKSSHLSKASSLMLKEMARIAELKVEEEFLLQKQEKDRELREIEEAHNKMKLQLEIKKSEARMSVYQQNQDEEGKLSEFDEITNKLPVDESYTMNYIERLQSSIQQDEECSVKKATKNINDNDQVNLRSSDQSKSHHHRFKSVDEPFKDKVKEAGPSVKFQVVEASHTEEMTKLVKLARAPAVKIDSFNGNPVDFPYFIANFTQAVDENVPDERGKLTRLIDCTTGEPHELVKSCVYLDDKDCYQQAKELLKKKYGSPHTIASEYRKQLVLWPKLKANDTQAFDRFENYLIKYQASMRAIGKKSQCNLELIQLLQSKMPPFLQERWNRKVYQSRRQDKEAELEDFISFVSEETVVMSDPFFSRGAINEMLNRAPSDSNKPRPPKSFRTGVDEKLCLCCKKSSHDLEKCQQYLALDLPSRRKFIYKWRLCFCCLNRTSDSHRAKTCPKKRKCQVCKRNHPTTLHDPSYQPRTTTPPPATTPPATTNPSPTSETTTTTLTTCSTGVNELATLCIVAVKVHHTSNPNIYVETLALLDNGSQATFVTDDVLSNLDAPSTDTNLEINTVSGTTTERSSIINGLCVCAIDQPIPLSIKLPKVYSRSTLPSDEADIPTPAQLQPWPYLNQIANHLPKIRGKVGLLIGSNCPKALEPMEIVHSRDNGPFAFRSRLGWCITGQVKSNSSSTSCHRIQVQDRTDQYFQVRESFKDLSLKEMIIKASTLDFHESSQLISLSQDDKRFLEIMKDIKYKDGHYYLPLPLRDPHKIIPNNRSQCLQRAAWLKQRLLKNDRMFNDYKAFMQTNIEKGYVKLASNSPTPNKTWYIPHHGVYHPRKPDKIRVVFDCTAKYQGYCLNQELIQGPDLTNQLIGVLLRFRQYPVAVMADIESMFYQVRVPEEFHDNLRFIWWPDGDLSKEPVDYQMCVHLFGATSSPSCANYALRQTADANKETYGDEASKSLYRNFYVDDLLKSYSNVSTAIQTTSDITKMCHSGGFRLTKFMSNEREFLATIPDQERAKSLKDLDMSRTQLPSDRALGMKWCPENDIFTYQLSTKEKPLTRRGLLSSISSVYDPLGLASPYLLEGKKLLQLICSERCGWDEPLSSDQSSRWIKWRKELVMLEQLQIDRCFRPKEFKDVVSTSLHHFSDASADAYGQVSYLRFKSSQDEIICKLVIAKSRVAPRKRPTIPRLELTAGVISVKVSLSLNNELDLEIDKNHYWTDSQVVLSYLLNEVKRFHLYVSNRVQFIREHTTIDQWKYVPSKENPADDTSRGLNLSTTNKNQRWLKGPVFLYRDESKWPTQPKKLSIGEDDREVKHVKVNTIKVNYDAIAILEIRISSWTKMKRVIARMLQWLIRYRRKLDVSIIQSAETVIFQSIQRRAFANDINNLTTKKPIKRHGSLWRLSPFLDSNSLIRVGGRISHSNVPEELKHPIILPKESNVTKMIVRAAHQQMQHGGRNATLSRLRDQGFWVINGNSLVRHIISKCVSCRRLRGAPSTQKMADLPEDRTAETAPFTYVGTDLFGPFMIKERRSLLKRYGIIFTCMSSRAVHLECVSTMDTDSFIQCLRRFIGRRGNIRLLRCDNGTNFVGARNELAKALQEMDEQAITNFLLSLGADFISWKHNTPTASNHGGVWERMIRTTRAILSSLMMTHGESLNDESFRTLLVEVEATINSRPLTVECINDPTSLTPISPSNILTMKSSVVMPPPGHFVKEDVFCRRRWRRVQHIANEFWSRWRKEYLTNLQARSKWCNTRRDLAIGDVVLMKEDTNRNCWKLALVQKLHESQDGHVRSVQIKQGSNTYDRPTNKLVLLVENDVKILKSSECTE